jgi:hypothetical protein
MGSQPLIDYFKNGNPLLTSKTCFLKMCSAKSPVYMASVKYGQESVVRQFEITGR